MTSVQCLSLIKLHYKLHAPTRRLVDIIVRDKPRIQLSNILNYVILTTGLSLVLRAYNGHAWTSWGWYQRFWHFSSDNVVVDLLTKKHTVTKATEGHLKGVALLSGGVLWSSHFGATTKKMLLCPKEEALVKLFYNVVSSPFQLLFLILFSSSVFLVTFLTFTGRFPLIQRS